MAKKIIIPNEEGILWLPKKDPSKKKKVDPITGKRIGQYGKMRKKIEFHEFTPEGWDNRSWRVQVYDLLVEAANKFDTTPFVMLANMGYDTNRNKQWVKMMRMDAQVYRKIQMDLIVKVSRLTHTPFIIY